MSSSSNIPSPGKAIVIQTERQFTPHISFFGPLDDYLGISMFWTDKIIALLLYLQRYAMILMWDVRWPQLYQKYSTFYYGFLLDFSVHPEGRDSLGVGTILEGCETGCRLIWPLVCIPIVLAWASASLFQGATLYYTRNIERILWTVMRVGLLPFCSMLVRYYILNLNGDLGDVENLWVTPTSEIGVVFLVCTIALFVYLGLKRSERQLLFRSSVRHESYLKTRELEYRLRLSATYRNERIWMISSYVYDAWFWSIARGIVDVVMLFIISFLPPKTGVILGDVILLAYFAYGFLYDIYRCKSTSHMEHVYNCTLFVYCVLATIQAYGVTSTWLIDTQLDYFLLSVGGATVGVTFCMAVYYFVDSHRFVSLTVAERRSNEKWRRIFGTAGGKYVQMDSVDLKPLSENELSGSTRSSAPSISEASFRRGGKRHNNGGSGSSFIVDDVDDDDVLAGIPSPDHKATSTTLRRRRVKKITVAVRKSNEGSDSFYLPRSGGFMTLDSGSDHLWPVHDGIINELLRLNQENHLIDMLRAGRAMLDRISSLHNTAILIPLDELKTHIFRLQQCVDFCRRYRVTHHCNLIHPLQAVFEDLIEQFTYELRIFSGISITVGHNAKKMINVSRELRVKQVQRDLTLALVSPLMRRVLVKLLALRLFVQLLEKDQRRTLLGRPIEDEEDADEFGPRHRRQLPGQSDDDDDDDDDDEDAHSSVRNEEGSLLGRSRDAKAKTKTAVFQEEDPFADAEEIDPFADDASPHGGDHPSAFDFGGPNANLYDDLPPVDADDNDANFAALLAQEAKKLIRPDHQ